MMYLMESGLNTEVATLQWSRLEEVYCDWQQVMLYRNIAISMSRQLIAVRTGMDPC